VLNENLNPTQFGGGDLYHGTAHPFRGDETILSAHDAGTDQNFAGRTDDVSGTHTYATTDLATAHAYAQRAADHAIGEYNQTHKDMRPLYTPATAHVYKVQPMGSVEKDPEDNNQEVFGTDPSKFRSQAPMQPVGDVSQQAHNAYTSEFGQETPVIPKNVTWGAWKEWM
jgi:hypothetical protein